MKTIEVPVKRHSKIKTEDYHIEKITELNYNWIKDKQLSYDDSEYTKENY